MNGIRRVVALAAVLLVSTASAAEPLLAGASKVDITKKTSLPFSDPLHVRALVLKQGDRVAVLLTLDAVAIGEIGPIKNDYLDKVRARLEKDLRIPAAAVIANASHCHGIVCDDVDDKTVEAVQLAVKNLVPVKAGVGVGSETRVSENRRLKLKNGKEADVRHAYSLPPDSEIVGLGPIDPQIGLLRLDRLDGRPLAAVYNFACHPIMGMPNGGNTADITGFSSRVIEENLGEGSIALFVQGCGGDINPAGYKDVAVPRNAETLGNRLGLSTLQGLRAIRTVENAPLIAIRETLPLPRADHTERIDELEAEQARLVKSLQGTTLNLKTFLELATKYNLASEFPSTDALRYIHEKAQGRDDLAKLDENNRQNLKAYIANMLTTERITRTQTNLALLKKHQAANLAAGRKPLEVDVMGLRVGDFKLVTFPGELTVEIGLKVKKRNPGAFVAGYTNGYIYYTPTAEQMKNTGGAQEDSDCRVAPEWEALFHRTADAVLKKLN